MYHMYMLLVVFSKTVLMEAVIYLAIRYACTSVHKSSNDIPTIRVDHLAVLLIIFPQYSVDGLKDVERTGIGIMLQQNSTTEMEKENVSDCRYGHMYTFHIA